MSADWIGIGLSIPIGIATALVTPWIQRKLEERGKERSLERTRNLLAEFDEVTRLRKSPTELTHYLIVVTLKTTFIGAVMGTLSGAAFFVGQMVSATAGINEAVFFTAGQFIALIGSVMIVNTCRPALLNWSRLRNYDEYAASVKAAGLSQVSHE